MAAALIPSLPFGDGSTQTEGATGVTQDSSGFAALEFDSLSNTDHAQYRQYSPGEGSWMSPDPYSGSYDFTNPQSLNRYSYALNNPAWFNDPSGLQNGDPPPPGGGDCGVLCDVLTLGIVAGLDALIDLFDSPSFHGTLQPRPTVSNGTYTFQVNAWGTPLYPNLSPALLGVGGLPLVAPNNGRNCSAGPASAGQYIAATAEAATLTSQWASGLGPGNRTFGPDTATSAVMGQSAGVQDALNEYYITGATHDLYSFGAPGYVNAGLNPVAQFVGSFRWSVSGNILTLTNTTSFKSLTYDKGPQWQRSSFGPGGNTHQVYQIRINCH